MADAKTAILATLIHEGGYVNDPGDSGGPTNGGITQKDVPDKDVETLTEDDKITYYLENYWKSLYSDIINQNVANKLFDFGVLFGIGTAVKNLQETLGITADGVFGPNTLTDTNAADSEVLLKNFQNRIRDHAVAIASDNPPKRKYLVGWIRRIFS